MKTSPGLPRAAGREIRAGRRPARSRPSAGLEEPVRKYYEDRLRRFGATPAGVDWNSAESQELRFRQLLRLFEEEAAAGQAISLNDLGCGYGALADYLEEQKIAVRYCGYDIAPAMVAAALARAGGNANRRFTTRRDELEVADYTVASGVFNVRLEIEEARWRRHVHRGLADLAHFSRRGFAFNCLTSYSETERRSARLYYADPRGFFHLLKRRYSSRVALLHDYGLYEFTMLVRADRPGQWQE